MNIQEAHESGWEGQEAEDFVRWNNRVERLWEARTGIDLWSVVGDWPSADTFSSGLAPEEALETVAEYTDDPDLFLEML